MSTVAEPCRNHLATSLPDRLRSRPVAPKPRPIRVAFVLHAMQVAGAEVLVKETIQQLGTRIQPTVLCLDAIGPLGHQLQGQGIDVICLDRKPGRDWRVAWRLAKELRQRRIERPEACLPFSLRQIWLLAILFMKDRITRWPVWSTRSMIRSIESLGVQSVSSLEKTCVAASPSG